MQSDTSGKQVIELSCGPDRLRAALLCHLNGASVRDFYAKHGLVYWFSPYVRPPLFRCHTSGSNRSQSLS